MRHECVLAPDLWPAEVDELQIRQVINGLVLNAREATPFGGSIRLQAENVVLNSIAGAEFQPGNYLRITVVDSGPGIPPEVLPKIFDPYFSTKHRGVQKGMGLGLSICRTIIQEHGGMIAVDSDSIHGTTVTCHLPAATGKRQTVGGGSV